MYSLNKLLLRLARSCNINANAWLVGLAAVTRFWYEDLASKLNRQHGTISFDAQMNKCSLRELLVSNLAA